MSVGLEEAARRAGLSFQIPLAVDVDANMVEIYRDNLPKADAKVGDVAELFDGRIGARLTTSEQTVAHDLGDIDVLVGGPPCQGHSNLNNSKTRLRDPRNLLYLRMARAAEVLRPKVLIIENVVPIQHDKAGVLTETMDALRNAGYAVAGRVVDLRRVGIPQGRRRYLVLASCVSAVQPEVVLGSLGAQMRDHPERTVRWAIHDLRDADGCGSMYDRASQPSKDCAKRIAYLFDKGIYDLPNKERPRCHRDKEHKYVSMYGRLRWDRPAQTITSGFGSMGQGRYVHPARRRTLTPHEAARLQTFPDWFSFAKAPHRTVLATVIGNAVPPLLMVDLGGMILPILCAAHREAVQPAS